MKYTFRIRPVIRLSAAVWLTVAATSLNPRATLADDSPVSRFVADHCLDCHQGPDPAGELDLQQLAWPPTKASELRQWVRIHDRIASQEMPPDPQTIPEADRSGLLATMSVALHELDHAEVQRHGRGTFRRLNRREFQQDLRQLLQLPDLDIQDLLPEDRQADQTNKSAAALDVTRVQLAAWLRAADVALRQAVASGSQPRTPVRYHALATQMFPKAVDHAGRESSFYARDSKMIPLTSGDLNRIRSQDVHDDTVEIAIFRSATWPYYGYPEGFLAAEDGRYEVRFEARAVRQLREFRLRPADEPWPLTFRARQPSKADVSGDVRATGGIIDIDPQPRVYETSVLLKRGETIEYSLLGLPVPFPITSHGGPLYYDFPPMPEAGHPGIAFRWIQITGPIDSAEWPPPSHAVLFDDLPISDDPGSGSTLPIEVISTRPQQDAARLLKRFAEKAAGQPVPANALKIYEQLIHQQLQSGRSFAESMLAGYQALLCSGHFLFLTEPADQHDHTAIATRLSHFLWNCRPDEELQQQAVSGRLAEPAVLRQQVDRLIDDPRFEHFVENFTDYWLDLRHLKRDSPDIRLYPEYRGDDYLIESMGWEPRAFISTVIRQNLPVASLVDADFVMVNDRLARHYQLPQVNGSAVRPVPLPEDSIRGGLLTQAAILKVTANGTTTSPIIRGAWVVDRLLGDPPPPPPPDVPAVEPDIRGATTIREILARHASDASCAGCHAKFDPVGLALENFDVGGAWRDRYRSLEQGDEITGIDRAGHQYSYFVASAVDSSGQLPDGRLFADIAELKQLLAAQPRPLARNLLQRFTAYATGTAVRFSDRQQIEALLDETAADGYRVRDLLHALIFSRIFRGEGATVEQSDSVTVGQTE